ncbi:fibroblast growth factor receptor 4-like isoform X2 [Ruditapes philippinarum]|uniref:fibroblast growth factor receptor 4-like isoform X2 n=1 Tax=Ruditapes philippinarum TaxID=129788 RepID=UPI00295B5687|nr:fibroblast growth factor receptor 4-like isoform X2 [Ruditapes philippinarum]
MDKLWINISFLLILSFGNSFAILKNCKEFPGDISNYQIDIHGANDKDLELLDRCLDREPLIFRVSVQESNISSTALVSSLPERVRKTTSVLIVNKCDLKRIPSRVLTNMTNIHIINFANNTITELEDNSFQNMLKVTSINLSYNNLTRITSKPFNNLPSLVELSLESNGLIFISSNAFLMLPKLDVLYFDHNNLQDIPYKTFRNSPIKYWHLAYNNITMISSKIEHFPHINSLDIRHNRLKSISQKLSVLHNLRELHICGNQLTTLPWQISSLLKNNRTFHMVLGDNPWHCDCDLIWLISFSQKGSFSENLNCTTPENIGMNEFNVNDIECIQGVVNREGIIWYRLVAIVLPALLVLFGFIIGVLLYFCKNRTKKLKKPIQMILNGQYYRPRSVADTAEVSISTSTLQNIIGPNDNEIKLCGTLRLGKLIGRGAFGNVFEGFVADADSKWKKVAVKQIRENAKTDDTETFSTEYRTLISIGNHPNIIQIFGTGEIDGSLIMVLEFADNGDLLAHLKWLDQINSKVIQNLDSSEWKAYLQNTQPRLFLYMWHIAKGMEFLSRLKIVHRDLAGRNILLSSDYVAKISDFGLSRDVHENGYYYQNSNGRMPYKWMSPESLSSGRYTCKSDIWSFGILLWEIVTLGAGPYPGIPPDLLLDMYRNNYIMPPPPLCPDYIYSIMEQCWSSLPENRPGFETLLETFDKLLQAVAQKASHFCIIPLLLVNQNQ